MRKTIAAFAVALMTTFTLGAVAAETSHNRASSASVPITLTSSVQPPTDVLRTDYGHVAEHLWESLYDLGFHGDPTDGSETFYIPFGTVVDVPGGLYLATADGWMVCADNLTVTGVECSAIGPVVPLGDRPLSGDYIPGAAPSGAPLLTMWEDGSGEYADGLMFDPESRVFRLPIRL